jgi:hypothetical protein
LYPQPGTSSAARTSIKRTANHRRGSNQADIPPASSNSGPIATGPFATRNRSVAANRPRGGCLHWLDSHRHVNRCHRHENNEGDEIRRDMTSANLAVPGWTPQARPGVRDHDAGVADSKTGVRLDRPMSLQTARDGNGSKKCAVMWPPTRPSVRRRRWPRDKPFTTLHRHPESPRRPCGGTSAAMPTPGGRVR